MKSYRRKYNNLVCVKSYNQEIETMSNVMEVIKKRSSTRGYTGEPLTAEELNVLIHAGLQAPTFC